MSVSLEVAIEAELHSGEKVGLRAGGLVRPLTPALSPEGRGGCSCIAEAAENGESEVSFYRRIEEPALTIPSPRWGEG